MVQPQTSWSWSNVSLRHRKKTQRVVWIDGPHPASSHDLTISHRKGGLGDQVQKGTCGIGDSAFSNESENIAISHPGEREDIAKMKARLKARHETFNGRIKGYSILSINFLISGIKFY